MSPAPHQPVRRGAQVAHDRWLVSYADLVTLLLAFFTTLYAASTVDQDKLRPLASSLQSAFDAPSPGGFGGASTPMLAAGASTLVPPVAIMARHDAMDALRRTLDAALADAIADRRVEVIQDRRGLVISMPDDAAFPSAGAEITPVARQMIERVAGTLQTLPNAIRIEGHTDDMPISTEKYGSNWELSTARASAVVAHLVTTAGIAPSRLSAAGYGEFHPRVPNTSAEHRARNRRIDIVVLESR
jgi:chemotaxis protein MotB